ncbi:MAG: hypothetical protein MJA29_06165, partial [Candidatus Omnitrophica bacterium]|nr:hypothetical protein [Candidatus Omnitrophota bacterium]
RDVHGKLQQVLNQAVSVDDEYNANITAILVDLDNNTVVPNSTGLADAASLDSDAEAVTLQSHLQTILTSHNGSAFKQLRIKAAGSVNTAGEI